jgi:excisionase family DNA binding protein
MEDKNLLNERQAAERLGVAMKTMQQWRHHGKGPKWVKVGRLARYRSADLDAYITSRIVNPAA